MPELKTLLRFARPYRWFLVLATLCMVLVTAMNVIAPWMIRTLIRTITDGVASPSPHYLSQVRWLALWAVGIYFFRSLFQFGTDYISHYAAWNILKEIRQFLYDHLQKLSLRYYQDKQTGDLMSRVIDDTRNFEQLLAHAIPTVVVNALMIVGVSAILFVLNAGLALYTLIPIPFLIFMVLRFSRLSRPLFRQAQDRVGELSATLQDNFSGMKEIKAFAKEHYESRRMGHRIAEQTRTILQALRLSNAFSPSIEFVSSLGTVIVIAVGGALALERQLPLEDLVAFLLYLGSFYQPITALGRINEGLQQALASAERVLDIINARSEIQDAPSAFELDAVGGKLEFSQVSFHYLEGIPVLKNISFTVNPGETLALVGPTGVGKTTIANLIPRFYDPIAGEIRVDGVDIRHVTQASLRRNISIVSQDVFLFNGTVRENILYGKQDATDAEVMWAAKQANAHEFITELAEGYETRVGERGVKLSGGQKQRISIARAILRDTPILVLDEATSSVDTHTETLIQEALGKLKANRTTVVIAHRLSTIQEADQIVVMQDGEIVEQGKHVELVYRGGLYSRLSKAQDAAGALVV